LRFLDTKSFDRRVLSVQIEVNKCIAATIFLSCKFFKNFKKILTIMSHSKIESSYFFLGFFV